MDNIINQLRTYCKDPSIVLESSYQDKFFWYIGFSPPESKSGLRLAGIGNDEDDTLQNIQNAINYWVKNNLF